MVSLRYGGFYSHDDVREVLRYAEQRGITVVPKIDVPGHCYAALQALPELAKTVEKRKAPRSVQGTARCFWKVFGDVYGMSVFQFFEYISMILYVCLHLETLGFQPNSLSGSSPADKSERSWTIITYRGKWVVNGEHLSKYVDYHLIPTQLPPKIPKNAHIFLGHVLVKAVSWSTSQLSFFFFIWLVVWNIYIHLLFFPYIGDNDPNWRTPSFFRGVGQPPTSYVISIIPSYNHI